MGSHDLAGDVESEAQVRRCRRRGHLRRRDQRLEDSLAFVLRNRHSSVVDRQDHVTIFPAHSDGYSSLLEFQES